MSPRPGALHEPGYSAMRLQGTIKQAERGWKNPLMTPMAIDDSA